MPQPQSGEFTFADKVRRLSRQGGFGDEGTPRRPLPSVEMLDGGGDASGPPHAPTPLARSERVGGLETPTKGFKIPSNKRRYAAMDIGDEEMPDSVLDHGIAPSQSGEGFVWEKESPWSNVEWVPYPSETAKHLERMYQNNDLVPPYSYISPYGLCYTIDLLTMTQKGMYSKSVRKIRRRLRPISAGPNATFGTVMRNLPTRQVYLSSHVTVVEVDLVSETFTMFGFFNFFWQDPTQATLFATERLAGRSSSPAMEPIIDASSLPVNPEVVFRNRAERIEHLTAPKFFFYRNNNTVHMQLYVRAVLNESMELQQFPFDRQFLNLQIAGRSMSKDRNFRWEWLASVPPWVGGEERFNFHFAVVAVLSSQVQGQYTQEDPWIDYSSCEVSDTRVIRLRIERRPCYTLVHVVLPIAIVTVSAFTCYYIDIMDIGARLQVTLTMLLSASAFQIVVAAQLPKIDTLTLMDKYVLLSFVFLGLSTLGACLTHAWEEHVVFSENAVYIIDTVMAWLLLITWTLATIWLVLPIHRIDWDIMLQQNMFSGVPGHVNCPKMNQDSTLDSELKFLRCRDISRFAKTLRQRQGQARHKQNASSFDGGDGVLENVDPTDQARAPSTANGEARLTETKTEVRPSALPVLPEEKDDKSQTQES